MISHRPILLLALLTACDPSTDESGLVESDTAEEIDTGDTDPRPLYKRKGTITGNEEWPADSRNQIGSDILIDGGHLIIGACTLNTFEEGKRLVIRNGGSLTVEGSEDCGALLTSASSFQQPGDWGGIQVDEGSRLQMTHTTLEFAGASSGETGRPAIRVAEGAALDLAQVTLRHNDADGIVLRRDAIIEGFTSNRITQNGGHPLVLPPGLLEHIDPGVYGPNERDAILVTHSEITRDLTWRSMGVPIELSEGLLIRGNRGSTAELTLLNGVELAPAPGQNITVGIGGSLQAEGRSGVPVTITSASTEERWGNLTFEHSSLPSTLSHTVIGRAGADQDAAVFMEPTSRVTLDNVTFDDNGAGAIHLQSGLSLVDSTNVIIQNHANAPLKAEVWAVAALTQADFVSIDNATPIIDIIPGTLTSSATWSDSPFALKATGGFALVGGADNAAELTVAAGVSIELGNGADVNILGNSSVQFNGSSTNPIEVRNSPGSNWGRFTINPEVGSSASQFHHVSFINGGDDGDAMFVGGTAEVDLFDVSFSSASTCDVTAQGDFWANAASDWIECVD